MLELTEGSRSINGWADFWRYKIGVNVIPADTRNKKPKVDWKQHQSVPILEDQHNQWKQENAFNDGMAIIAGKVWHNPAKKGLYLICVDLDNEKAIEEFCNRNGVKKPLKELAKQVIIEQHKDEPNKAHAIFYATHPFPKKSSDATGLSKKLDNNEIPAIEVKGSGEHGLLFCTPSPHKNGSNYQIMEGAEAEPAVIDELEDHIREICEKYHIQYLRDSGLNSIPIRDLFKEGTKILEGHNRHEALLRVMESLIRRNQGILTEVQIKRLAAEWNQRHCVPPLIEREFEDQWSDATNFIRKRAKELNSNTDQTRAYESEEYDNNAGLILQKAKEKCNKLFLDEYRVSHAAIIVDNHLEVIPLSSKRFRNWISRIIYKEENIVVDSSSLKDAIGILSAEADFGSGDPIKLGLRVATLQDNYTTKWYYDLTNKDWEFIEVTSEGWEIIKNIVIFRRFNNQLSQVYPSRDYPQDIFDKFIKLLNLNVKDQESQILLKCYIVCLFVPDVAKAVLMPHGHQGSAKTTLVEFIKMLVDPSIVRTLSFPRDINELIQQLSHNYLGFYDNISDLPDWISDEICRAVTGSGSSKRVLYTDDDDFIRSLKRCIALNGINLAARKADLLDRSILIQLNRIQDENRRKLTDLEKEFEVIKPQLLGYILDTLVSVLRWKQNGDLKLAKLPRMADFRECCEVISRCMGNRENAFLDAYDENIKLQTEQVIESSQVAQCVRHLVMSDENEIDRTDSTVWTGTATSLLSDLEEIALELKINIKGKYWPKAPNQLSRKLNEAAPTLRDIGIEVEWIRDSGKARTVKICKLSSLSSSSLEGPKTTGLHESSGNVDIKDKTSSQSVDQNRAELNKYDDVNDSDDALV